MNDLHAEIDTLRRALDCERERLHAEREAIPQRWLQ